MELDPKKFAELLDKIEAEADEFLLARTQVLEICLVVSTWKYSLLPNSILICRKYNNFLWNSQAFFNLLLFCNLCCLCEKSDFI